MESDLILCNRNSLILFLLVSCALLFAASCKKYSAKSEWETYCEETALGGEISSNFFSGVTN